jgi:hypothetical protein
MIINKYYKYYNKYSFFVIRTYGNIVKEVLTIIYITNIVLESLYKEKRVLTIISNIEYKFINQLYKKKRRRYICNLTERCPHLCG